MSPFAAEIQARCAPAGRPSCMTSRERQRSSAGLGKPRVSVRPWHESLPWVVGVCLAPRQLSPGNQGAIRPSRRDWRPALSCLRAPPGPWAPCLGTGAEPGPAEQAGRRAEGWVAGGGRTCWEPPLFLNASHSPSPPGAAPLSAHRHRPASFPPGFPSLTQLSGRQALGPSRPSP